MATSSVLPRPPPLRDPSPIEARLQLAAIVDSSDDAIMSKDLNGVITTWNFAATRMFGYLPDEIIGKSVLTLIPEDQSGNRILRKVTSGQRIEHFETRRRRKSGELIHISLTISPIRNGSGRIVGISKIARDITDRKLAEAALFESERMAAIGRLAASIAHEVNNPLEAILNLTYLLARHPSLDEEAQRYTQLLLSEVVRVGEITARTLSFYRDTSQPVEIDMLSLIDGILKLHQPLLQLEIIYRDEAGSPRLCLWTSGRTPPGLHQPPRQRHRRSSARRPHPVLGVNCGPDGEGACVTPCRQWSRDPPQLLERSLSPSSPPSVPREPDSAYGSVRESSESGGNIRLRSWTAPTRKTGTIFASTCQPVLSIPGSSLGSLFCHCTLIFVWRIILHPMRSHSLAGLQPRNLLAGTTGCSPQRSSACPSPAAPASATAPAGCAENTPHHRRTTNSGSKHRDLHLQVIHSPASSTTSISGEMIVL